MKRDEKEETKERCILLVFAKVIFPLKAAS